MSEAADLVQISTRSSLGLCSYKKTRACRSAFSIGSPREMQRSSKLALGVHTFEKVELVDLPRTLYRVRALRSEQDE